MEISVTLSIGNKLYSRHHLLFFSFLCDHFVDVTALNLLSSLSPAKLVYYTAFSKDVTSNVSVH